MYSIIAVVALFIAIIFNDLLQQTSSEIPKHALFGLICTLGIFILWYNDLELVGWGLLVVPIFILFISFVIVLLNKKSSSSTCSSTTSTSKYITSGINKNDMGWNGHSKESNNNYSWDNKDTTDSKHTSWLDRIKWDKSDDTTSSSNTTKLSIPESSITPTTIC